MNSIEASSFRDPSAFVFTLNGVYYRHIQPSYKDAYDHLMLSGLYKALTEKGWLITHEEVSIDAAGAYKVIKPRQLAMMNYPYEWGFQQLKAAALHTLHIQKLCMAFGMTLKDATGFNICFEGSTPVFIDTTSFSLYDETKPWIAYTQFCKQFLAPLLLASYKGSWMLGMLAQYPDGIPLELAAKLLPGRAGFHLLAALHVLLPAKMSGTTRPATTKRSFTRTKQLRIIDHLITGIGALHISREKSHWSKYYGETILSTNYLEEKIKTVDGITKDIQFSSLVDLGANTGVFSIFFAEKGKRVIAVDADRICVDRMFEFNTGITAIYVDLMHPSPSMGWMNKERPGFLERVNTDLTLALALVHHLCIAKNLSLPFLAEGLAKFSPQLLIEFVPKEDPKAQLLLEHREDIFSSYTESNFRHTFLEYFDLIRESPVPGSARKLFLFKRK